MKPKTLQAVLMMMKRMMRTLVLLKTQVSCDVIAESMDK
jgi:hypothetical protein